MSIVIKAKDLFDELPEQEKQTIRKRADELYAEITKPPRPGNRTGQSSITPSRASEIRADHLRGLSVGELVAKHRVSPGLIGRILEGER